LARCYYYFSVSKKREPLWGDKIREAPEAKTYPVTEPWQASVDVGADILWRLAGAGYIDVDFLK